MALFRRTPPLQELQASIADAAKLADSLSPIFIDAICVNSRQFIIDNSIKRREMPADLQASFTDEMAIANYGVDRKQLSLITLKIYLIFNIMGYMQARHLVVSKDLPELQRMLESVLISNAPAERIKSEWQKVLLFKDDKFKQAAFVMDHILHTMGVLDNSIDQQDSYKIFDRHVPLMEFICLCIMLRIDKLLVPGHYKEQLKLFTEYRQHIEVFNIEMTKINGLLSV